MKSIFIRKSWRYKKIRNYKGFDHEIKVWAIICPNFEFIHGQSPYNFKFLKSPKFRNKDIYGCGNFSFTKFCTQNKILALKNQRSQKTRDPRGGGLLHNFQYGEVHANIWGPKFYVKSIFGVCELQHGQKFNILGP